MYFQVTNNASTAKAGAYLVPTIVGNTVGGLITGAVIKKTGRYKYLITLASLSSCLCFTLMLTIWKGNTHFGESLAVFPGGFATGVAYGAVFVALTAGVAEDEIPIAASGLYLSGNVGCVAGIAAVDAVYQNTLRSGLVNALQNNENRDQVSRESSRPLILRSADTDGRSSNVRCPTLNSFRPSAKN
jgi:fucose permease